MFYKSELLENAVKKPAKRYRLDTIKTEDGMLYKSRRVAVFRVDGDVLETSFFIIDRAGRKNCSRCFLRNWFDRKAMRYITWSNLQNEGPKWGTAQMGTLNERMWFPSMEAAEGLWEADRFLTACGFEPKRAELYPVLNALAQAEHKAFLSIPRNAKRAVEDTRFMNMFRPLTKAEHDWLAGKAPRKMERSFIFYNRKENKAFCYSCGKTYEASRIKGLKHNAYVKCPCCGKVSQAKSDGMSRASLRNVPETAVFYNVKGDHVLVRMRNFFVDYSDCYKPSVWASSTDYIRVVITPDGRRVAYLNWGKNRDGKYEWRHSSMHPFEYSYRDTPEPHWYLGIFNRLNSGFGVTYRIPGALKQKLIDYCVPRNRINDNLPDKRPKTPFDGEAVISSWWGDRWFESLNKLGFHQLADDYSRFKLNSQWNNYYYRSSGFNTKAKNLHGFLSIRKEYLKVLMSVPAENRAALTADTLHWYQDLSKLKRIYSKQEVVGIRAFALTTGASNLSFLSIFEKAHVTLHKAEKYLLSDRVQADEKEEKEMGRGMSALNAWTDYLSMAMEYKDGKPLTKREKYPAHVYFSHNLMSEQLKEKKDPSYKSEISEKCKKAEKLFPVQKKMFNYQFGDYILKAPEKGKEIIYEGKINGNCVATYLTRVSEGKSIILFVRKADCPDMPYYTMEIDPKSMDIVQFLGKFNYEPTPELKDFEEHFTEDVLHNRLHSDGKIIPMEHFNALPQQAAALV